MNRGPVDVFTVKGKPTLGKSDKISEIIAYTIEICKLLSCSCEEFDSEIVIEKICMNFVIGKNRFLYSEISNYLFSIKPNVRADYYSNLDMVVGNALSKENLFDGEDVSERVHKIIYKLYDHSNLVAKQIEQFSLTDLEFSDRFNTNMVNVKGDIDRELYSHKQETMNQLISIVGIFTAMSFLVFGGINSLDNIFQGLSDMPVLKLMMVGCIWGICLLNLIFVFMYFVAKITKKSIKTNERHGANFVQRYPFTCWSNLVMVTLLGIISWLYYIDSQNIGEWFVGLSVKYQGLVCVVGFLTILVAFAGATLYLFCKCKEEVKWDNTRL